MLKKRILEPEENTTEYINHALRRNMEHGERIAKHIISQLKPLKGTEKVLEVACGVGAVSHWIAYLNKGATVLGVDSSEKAIDLASEVYGFLPNISYAEQSVYVLSEDDNSQDLVLCWSSLHHFEDPRKAIGEMLRVTKKGGTVFLDDYSRTIDEAVLKEIERSITSGRINCPTIVDSIRASLTPEELNKIMQELGVNKERYVVKEENCPVPAIKLSTPTLTYLITK